MSVQLSYPENADDQADRSEPTLQERLEQKFHSCVCVCEGNRVTSQQSVQPVRNHSTLACVLQIHTSIIQYTPSVTQLCSPFRLELMVKLMTLLTVLIFTLKAEARDYGKGYYISDMCLWCSANHNALGQQANQSRLCLSEGGAL